MGDAAEGGRSKLQGSGHYADTARSGAFEQDYREWDRLYAAQEWSEVVRVAGQMKARWAQQPEMSLEQRTDLSTVLLGACFVSAHESPSSTGQIGEAALTPFDELLAWIRLQPESQFRIVEGLVLCERMKECVARVEALDSLEELAELVGDSESPSFRKNLASSLVDRIHWLFYTPAEDQKRYQDALSEVDDGAYDPDALGITDPTVLRMERLADAFTSLAECLEIDDDDDAKGLRAVMLTAAINAAGRLGQAERTESLYGQLATLGDAGLTALDTMIAEAYKINPDPNNAGVALTVASGLMGKVGLLSMNGDNAAALAIVTELIDRFSSRSEPVFGAIVSQAKAVQASLLEDADD